MVQFQRLASFLPAVARRAVWCLSGLAVIASGAPAQNADGSFAIDRITTGTGPLYPYRIRELDAFGNPTTRVLEIRDDATLRRNLTRTNGVLPLATYSTTPVLPNGAPGNQFLLVRFRGTPHVKAILSSLPAHQPSGLSGALAVVAYDPATETTVMVPGRGFVGGVTYYDDLSTPGLDLKPVRAVAQVGNQVVVLDRRAQGFPLGFVGDAELVAQDAFVFVPDADAQLATFETFPAGRVLRVVAFRSVHDARGTPLSLPVCVATTVGPDTTPPAVLGSIAGVPFIVPGNGATQVDLRTPVQVFFSKPVQPLDVGTLVGRPVPLAAGVQLAAQVGGSVLPLAAFAEPVSFADLCSYVLLPAASLPGQTVVTVDARATVHSLNGVPLSPTVQTSFTTRPGPGILNAPVAPEAIYIGHGGSGPGVAVLDLNGFGQGTGNPQLSRFVRNPNVGRPGVFPPLSPGVSSLDGGGEGALTLARDHLGQAVHLGAALVGRVGDLHIGQPLDLLFHNGAQNPFLTGNQVNPGNAQPMAGNSISVAPHPNPPRIDLPVPNPGMGILSEEPTVTTSGPPFLPGVVMTTAPPCRVSPINILVPGNPFHITNPGLFGANFPGVFNGPQPTPPQPSPPVPYCPYTSRQQIGHFLYVLDREHRGVLVVHSNQMRLLGFVPLPDPTSMAMAPNLRLLAVSNFGTNTVSFVDVDPRSPTFHAIVGTAAVGAGPGGLAWQPEGEDLLVCNTTASSVTVIDGRTLRPRKTVTAFLRNPLDVAVTLRENTVGFATRTYFAYVLNADGTVAVFQSGPSGLGPDDIVTSPAGLVFPGARTLQPDLSSLTTACWIPHVDGIGLGQVSKLELTSTGPPQWSVTARIGGSNPTTPVRDRLSGNVPVDLAFDDVRNEGWRADARSQVVPGILYAQHSGKGHAKQSGVQLVPAVSPHFVIVALADVGKVDVFDVATGARIRTVDTPGVSCLSHYWRQ